MVVFTQFTALAAGLSTIASAVPIVRLPTVNPRRAFSVGQVSKPLSKEKEINLDGVYANTLVKYGAQVPDNVKAAAETGSAIAKPQQHDMAYLTPVKVGESTLNLDIDTGSADLWVFSTQLSPFEEGDHSLYAPSSSATKMNGYSWQIRYGDGSSASGDVFRDVVDVGGVTAQRQAVEAAEDVSWQFMQFEDNDGLVGLAFSSINTVRPKPQKTFFDNVKAQLDNPLFAATLKHAAPGSYDFGFVDRNKYKGALEYVDVDNSRGFWMFSASGYGVGESTPNSNAINGIADTGTSLLLLPSPIVRDYYEQVEGAQSNAQLGGYYTFPCSTALPQFTLQIGRYRAVLPSEHLNYMPATRDNATCFGGIQSNGGLGFAIFGDVFLKSQYVVFDSEGPRLGFAAQA